MLSKGQLSFLTEPENKSYYLEPSITDGQLYTNEAFSVLLFVVIRDNYMIVRTIIGAISAKELLSMLKELNQIAKARSLNKQLLCFVGPERYKALSKLDINMQATKIPAWIKPEDKLIWSFSNELIFNRDQYFLRIEP
jgi:hypothetical protein